MTSPRAATIVAVLLFLWWGVLGYGLWRSRVERPLGEFIEATLTDDAVSEFYSCTLCQSFAPNHVCVITPERSGLYCFHAASEAGRPVTRPAPGAACARSSWCPRASPRLALSLRRAQALARRRRERLIDRHLDVGIGSVARLPRHQS